MLSGDVWPFFEPRKRLSRINRLKYRSTQLRIFFYAFETVLNASSFMW